MLKASKCLISYINMQKNKGNLAKKWGVGLATVYKIRNQESDIDGSTIAKILNDSGFAFDDAFELVED